MHSNVLFRIASELNKNNNLEVSYRGNTHVVQKLKPLGDIASIENMESETKPEVGIAIIT